MGLERGVAASGLGVVERGVAAWGVGKVGERVVEEKGLGVGGKETAVAA